MSYGSETVKPTADVEFGHTDIGVEAPGAVTVALCGSFRRDPIGLRADYEVLLAAGCRVLSPSDIEWAAEQDGFVFAASEIDSHPAEIEQQHLGAMRTAHFVWLHSPDGYVGRSAAMELGYAHALGLSIFTQTLPKDVVFAELVTRVDSPEIALAVLQSTPTAAPTLGLDSLQHYYRRAALARGWTEEDAGDCLSLLSGEVEELTEAVHKEGQGSRAAALEMADVQLYLAHLANIAGVDLAQAVAEKERINTNRFGPALPARVGIANVR
jgi:NTP pyrophosphatase (non-canonical NTP hydrolase)